MIRWELGNGEGRDVLIWLQTVGPGDGGYTGKELVSGVGFVASCHPFLVSLKELSMILMAVSRLINLDVRCERSLL